MYKRWREKTGMSQSEAARKMRLNIGFWCRVESGSAELPPKRYKKVSKVLGVPVRKLIDLRVQKFKYDLVSEVGK